MAGITIPLIVTGDAAIDAAVSKLARLDQAINKMAESQKRATSQSAQPLALEKPRFSRNQTEELLRLNKELEGIQNKQHFTLALLLKDLREYDKEMSKAASNARIELHGREAGIKAVEKQAKAYQTATAELAKFNAETFKQTERAKAILYAKQTPAKAEADLLRGQADTRQESRNLKDPAYIANEQRKIANAATKDAILLEAKLTAEATRLTAAEQAGNQALAASNEIRRVSTRAKQDALTANAREEASLAALNLQIANSVSSERIAAANKKIINDARVAAATSAEREKAALAALNLQIANSTSPERIAAERKKLAARTTLDAALAADREAAALAKLRTELATTDVKERERIKLLQELARAQAALAAQQGNAGAVKQTVAAKEQARAERELALLLARKSAAIAPLIAQIKKLREEEDRASTSTKQFSLRVHLASQGAAAMRSAMYGMGASFGIFTSATLLVASSVYAVTAAFRNAVQSALEYEKALAALGAYSSRAQHGTQQYTKDLEELDKAIRQSALGGKFTTIETAEAMKQLALAGLTAGEAIEAVPATLRLAAIGAMDFGRAADIATNIMMGFQLQVKDLPRIVDVLSKAATESNTDVEQLGTAMSYAAPLAESFGVSLEYTTAAIEVLANSGIKASRAGTGMRRVFLSLFTPTEKIRAEVEKFGVTLGKLGDVEGLAEIEKLPEVFDRVADGSVEAQRMLEEFYVATVGGTKNLQLIRNAVGVYATPAMIQLVKSVGLGKKSVQELAEELKKAYGSSEDQSKKMLDNLKDVGNMMKAAGSVIAGNLFDNAEQGVRKFADSLLSAMRALAANKKATDALYESVLAIGKAILTVVGALVAYKTALGAAHVAMWAWSKASAVYTAIGTAAAWATTRVKALTVAQTALSSTSTLNLGLGAAGGTVAAAGGGALAVASGIGAVAALAAGVYFLYEQFSGIPEAIDKTNKAVDAFSEASGNASEQVKTLFQSNIFEGGLAKMYAELAGIQKELAATNINNTEQIDALGRSYRNLAEAIGQAETALKEYAKINLGQQLVKDMEGVSDAALLVSKSREELEAAQLALRQAADYRQLQRPSPQAADTSGQQAELAAKERSLELAEALLVTETRRRDITASFQGALLIDDEVTRTEELKWLHIELTEQLKQQEDLLKNMDPARGGVFDQQMLSNVQVRLTDLRTTLSAINQLVDAQAEKEPAAFDTIMRVRGKALDENEKRMRVLRGTELERKRAALDLANEELAAAKKQLGIKRELDASALSAAASNQTDAAARAELTRRQEEYLAATVGVTDATERQLAAQKAYDSELGSTTKSLDSTANAEAKLIKSAAELHEAHLTLIKDLADLKGGFEDLTEKTLARGIEFYEKLTAAGKKYSATIQVIRHSGAQLPGVGPISGGYTAVGGGVGAGAGTGTVLGASAVNIPRRSQMDQSFVAGLEQFIRAGKALGHAITVGSTFRTGAEQADLFRRKPNLAAPPGSSRHERGTAADLAFADAQSQRWAHESAAQYGLDFPMAVRRPGKKYEPWHIQQAGGGGSLAERNRDLTSENKSMLELKQTVESLTDAQRAEAEAAQARFTIAGHIESRRVLEIASYQELEKRAGELQRAEALLAQTTGADLPLAVDAAKRAQEAYSAELERNNQLHEAQLMWEEEGLRYYDLTALTVERNAKEIQVLTDKYVDGSAAMRDFRVAQAELNYLLEKGAIDWDQYDLAMSRNKKTLAAAQGNYEKFFADLTYDSDNFRDIATQGFTDLRDTTADIFSSIGADGKLQLSSIWEAGEEGFKKFLGNLRDAAAKFAADKVISSLFDPKSGLVSGGAQLATSFITSFFATGGAVQAGLPHGVYSRPTLFPMQTPGFHPYASGVGLLGEAGPEAILPLTRTSGGDLGVRATSQQPVVNVTVKNLPGQSAKTSQDNEGNITIEILEARLASRVMNGSSPLPRAMENSYGLRRT